ncbi:MAG: Holliday junction ATP-dependent DNA helicase RuvA [Microgenomates bacterium 39_7]|nr:MAG: Holliday junction ATP-dependent DNA helicase RuvA [Microgenomates bacterium 39_7]
MIGYLKGEPFISGGQLLILVQGVGYSVEVGKKTRASLNQSEVELFIYTHVREDKLELYGFPTAQQKHLFELLLDVSGVGPKTAIEITDQDPDRIVSAVQNSEVSFFNSIPRIGKKTAQKIILDLKSKLGSITELSLGPKSSQERDVFDALTALGYEESEIGAAINELDLEELSLEKAVKSVLKQLSPDSH